MHLCGNPKLLIVPLYTFSDGSTNAGELGAGWSFECEKDYPAGAKSGIMI